MSTRERTPSLLDSYLQIPSELSSTLLTGTLACSSSWLTARIISTTLQQDGASIGVVLVSWMNDETFWRIQLKRLAVVNLDRPGLNGRFVHVDRLMDSLDTFRSAKTELDEIEKRTTNALEKCQSDKVLLILDSPDAALATQPEVDALQLNALLMKLRMHPRTHAMVLTCVADLPRSRDGQLAPLELNNAAFITQQAHMAHSVISVRELETGSARDVSGIIRITNGGCGDALQELEKRYLVQQDGSVKIME